MSQRYETTGTIKRIGSTEVKSEKFSKRAFSVEIEDGKYPQICEFQVTGERCGQLDEFRIGDEVKIAWNLRGREWTGRDDVTKTFNSLDVWKLDRIGAARTATDSSYMPSTGGGPDDGIPFASCELGHEPSPIARVLR